MAKRKREDGGGGGERHLCMKAGEGDPATGTVDYWPRAIRRDGLFAELRDAIEWEQQYMYSPTGERVALPRKTCFVALKEDVRYRYSSTVVNVSRKMPESLVEVLREVERISGGTYNAAFLNYYESGENYIGWHADDEFGVDSSSSSGMKDGCKIASLSLGQARPFQLLHQRHQKKVGRTKRERQEKERNEEYYEFLLNDGDLLVMGGTLQRHWHHRVPKSTSKKHPMAARINITFRTFQ